ncbi:EAL domain-containing protein [Methylobacterium nonmethylotrophicum]|uniref:EAL domain-containing protein n=1 Tax=Methylobacterium nonmethylotrophicum TaxID=1141884 RepID=A0A4Z0NN62_9HYPH|nr:EAL domain-containing protein [Methylobacterium nonmethylotrophicum]TGD97348.1 EAL domain-containing protein [Methylobacterium nonmethylotrophicum]
MLKPAPSLGLFADLLDGLDIGLCVFDAEDRTLGWNQTFLYFFPEHDGFVHVGEHYRENLLRFYRTRLTSDEVRYVEEYVARAIARHQALTRPYEFEHRGSWLRVAAQTIPGLGRVRLWRRITREAEPPGGSAARGDASSGRPDGIAVANADGRIVSANRQFGQLYGLSPAEAVGMTLETVVVRAWHEAQGDAPVQPPAQLLTHLRESLQFTGAPFEVPLPGERWIRVIEHVREGGVRTGVHFDITALKREQAALRAAEAEARRSATHCRGIIEHAPAGMLVVDAAGILVEANRAFRHALGDGAAACLVGRPLAALGLPEDAGLLDAVLSRAGEDPGPAVCEMRFAREDGSTMWARVSAVRLHLPPDPVATLLQVEDITARREAERRIAHMARHDALTDLPNRTLFRERLDALLEAREACAILWLDLDRFKVVNDTLGHAAGDTLLCEVARRMQAALAPEDTIARLGGDEFAVLLGDADPLAASQAAARLVEVVQAPVTVAGRPMHLGASIGVVLAPRHGADADTLMARADRALYSAKAAGRSTFRLYDPAMEAAAAEQHGLELDLRLGLERGEFVLHYQPIVTAAERRVVCREALVRWRHPTRGLVPPAAFIPLAEETGLIDRLGAWILRRACRDAAGWADGTRVAVNVSAAQVRHGPLIAAVQAALLESGLRPDRLEIEITESLLVHADAADLLLALRRLGVRIALDDFGTGYSSLSYLRRFPFDAIKIDRSFIADIDDPDTAAIVRAVVGIAAQLGATITAEGVETEAQLAAILRDGCTEAQGYLFGRPVPLDGTRAEWQQVRT